MRKEIKDALEIIAWGLIGFAILVILLRWLGIIHSPELVLESLLAGLVFGFISIKSEIREIKVKLELLWLDFKKRKKLS
jgi:hypothetical protein